MAARSLERGICAVLSAARHADFKSGDGLLVIRRAAAWLGTPRVELDMTLRPTASGTVQFRFANNTAAAGRTSTARAGSTLLARKLG